MMIHLLPYKFEIFSWIYTILGVHSSEHIYFKSTSNPTCLTRFKADFDNLIRFVKNYEPTTQTLVRGITW